MDASEYIMQVACDEICYYSKTYNGEGDFIEEHCMKCPLDKAVTEVFSGYEVKKNRN